MSLFWEEDQAQEALYSVPDDILDLSFKVNCRSLPLDHAYALSQALLGALPWLGDEPQAGIHLIHGAESGNGWLRPEDPEHDVLYLSKRTRLTLRLPKPRIEAARTLQGRTLDIAGNPLELGTTSVRPLSVLTTIFARYVVAEDTEDEARFLQEALVLLHDKGIRVKKMMSGRQHTLRMPDEIVSARSLMLDGLEITQSVRLQQEGLGPGRKMGCGLFLPHKGIDVVDKA